MNDPASAFLLNLDDMSEDDMRDLITRLRARRLSDVERSRKSFAKKTVAKLSNGITTPKIKLSMQSVDQLAAAAGIELSPQLRAKLEAKLAKKA